MKCRRCGAAIEARDARDLRGLCLACLTAFAGEDLPEFPDVEALAPVGRGGMGVVYKARQKSLDRVVALKVLSPALAGKPGFAERFAREAKLLAQLNHPNLVTVHGFGADGGTPYLVLEFVEGESLRAILARERRLPGRATSLATQLCDALEYAHGRGVVHRDIKPENVLVSPDGRVKLADFGLAILAGPDTPRLTSTHVAVGTPAYMAPERLSGSPEIDARADLYGLGVLLYEVLTGELPVGRFPPPSASPGVNPGWDSIVLRLLEKDPARRPTASDVRAAVARLRPSRRGLFAAVLALLAVAIAAFAWPSTPAAWVELGGSATGEGISGPQPGAWPWVALDPEDRPVVGWDGPFGGQQEIYLRRWDGKAWIELGGSGSGGGLSANSGGSMGPAVAVGPDGHPVAAWRDDTSGNLEIYLKRWDGRAWVELG